MFEHGVTYVRVEMYGRRAKTCNAGDQDERV